MSSIIAVVAATNDGVIGRNGRIPWHLKQDLRRFHDMTLDHTVLMGRKTCESLPVALYARKNLVLSRNPAYKPSDCDFEVFTKPDDALQAWHSHNTLLAQRFGKSPTTLFVIGGAEVYQLMMPHVTEVRLTRINKQIEGDTFFPFDQLLGADWVLASSVENPVEYTGTTPYSSVYQVYRRNCSGL